MDSTYTHSEGGGVAAFEENFPWEFDASIRVGEANHSPGMSRSVYQKARDNGVERTCSGRCAFQKAGLLCSPLKLLLDTSEHTHLEGPKGCTAGLQY
jgi:hypothetical protein